MPSLVATVPAAKSADALCHYQNKLKYEADCWDTHESLKKKPHDFVLLDVRAPSLYLESHVPGALNLPHGKMIKRNMAPWPANTLFIVYCAGPHCNGADKAAIRLAELGRPVKIMIGGMAGWADEGFEYAFGKDPGQING